MVFGAEQKANFDFFFQIAKPCRSICRSLIDIALEEVAESATNASCLRVQVSYPVFGLRRNFSALLFALDYA